MIKLLTLLFIISSTCLFMYFMLFDTKYTEEIFFSLQLPVTIAFAMFDRRIGKIKGEKWASLGWTASRTTVRYYVPMLALFPVLGFAYISIYLFIRLINFENNAES